MTSASLIHKRRALLKRFAKGWECRDITAVTECMSTNCVYEASVGPEPGRTFKGALAVRAGILAMFDYDKGMKSRVHGLLMDDRRAAWEWTYVRTQTTGTSVTIRGCDIFEFKGIKIRRKSGFRKTIGNC